jgi:ribose transport system ATP-binding protein
MLVAENITKTFSGVRALDNVCMELHAGKVNAIIGENGAGKSTLMKVLSGVYVDYEGRIIYKGKPVRFQNTKQAQAAGIAIIHQELNLIPHLSITENIFLGREITNTLGLLDKARMRKRTIDLLERLRLDLDPDTPVAALKVGQQQVVEIAKALLTDADVIIMDEPTSAVSDNEVKVLFDIIIRLKDENKTIVYISHKLDELFKIADRFIVLRDGKTIESGEIRGMTQDNIIQKMVGREINIVRRTKQEATHTQLLSVNNLSLKNPVRRNDLLLKDISFTLHKKEILGVFGLMGAGRTELMETIFGLHAKRSAGKSIIDGKEISIKSPKDAMDAGIALVPEDRKKDGLVLSLDIRTNICLTTLDGLQVMGMLDARKETALSKKYISDLKIKTSTDKQFAKNLSGGNQQKIVLAKWLATQPKILILDEPTRGIDINAKNEIYKLILQLSGEGLGIIVISSELPEILALSDRILVMAEGTITAEFTAEEATEDKILKAAIPKTI